MSENITIALMSGAFSIVVALITIYHQDIVSIFRFRKRRIKGTWRGQGVERLLGSNPQFSETYDVSMELQQLGSRIKGKGTGRSSSGEYSEAKLKGKMEDEHFVTLSAQAISLQEFDIAVFLFELDAKGQKLHGYCLANGLSQHGITFSEISLTKEPR
jgi:hypothetical protein